MIIIIVITTRYCYHVMLHRRLWRQVTWYIPSRAVCLFWRRIGGTAAGSVQRHPVHAVIIMIIMTIVIYFNPHSTTQRCTHTPRSSWPRVPLYRSVDITFTELWLYLVIIIIPPTPLIPCSPDRSYTKRPIEMSGNWKPKHFNGVFLSSLSVFHVFFSLPFFFGRTILWFSDALVSAAAAVSPSHTNYVTSNGIRPEYCLFFVYDIHIAAITIWIDRVRLVNAWQTNDKTIINNSLLFIINRIEGNYLKSVLKIVWCPRCLMAIYAN